MRYSVVGGVTIEAWCDRADSLQRYFFITPRRREMQQADVFSWSLPTGNLLS